MILVNQKHNVAISIIYNKENRLRMPLMFALISVYLMILNELIIKYIICDGLDANTRSSREELIMKLHCHVNPSYVVVSFFHVKLDYNLILF